MTSKLTRERIELIANFHRAMALPPSQAENEELARMALAAMDSEPVAIIDQANLDYLRSGADADVWPPEREEMGDVLLYRHPQPAPVVPVVPDFKKLARELVDNLVDCGGLDEGVKEKYLEWAEKTCRAAMLAATPQEVK